MSDAVTGVRVFERTTPPNSRTEDPKSPKEDRPRTDLRYKDEYRRAAGTEPSRRRAEERLLGNSRPPPFNREAAAKAMVAHSNGAIREVPTPFPGSTLFEPTGKSKGAAILVLHGSEGGNQPYSMAQAAELARHGYAALAFSYFDVPGSSLPKKLVDVPLERTQQAADWLRARYGKVGLDGVSRGGEQALELASLDKGKTRFDAVAGEVPSSEVWGAWDPQAQRPITDKRGNIRPAWTLDGKPLQEGQPIALERYPGPVFLRGSGKDHTWPSADYVKQLEKRLEAHGKRAEVHIFPNEDHILSPQAWPKANKMLLDFFDRTLQ